MRVEAAIDEALRVGRALCKFITPNDVGETGSHQCGFYLPKKPWRMFASFGPEKGRNDESAVTLTWPDGLITNSRVKWYGRGTRSEYRLTRFGRNFPWLTSTFVGTLLVLVPKSRQVFSAHILDSDEEIELFQAALGLEVLDDWSVFDKGRPLAIETENECLDRVYTQRTAAVDEFPSGAEMADWARAAAAECLPDFARQDADDKLIRWVEIEYALFRRVEARLCQEQIGRSFENVDNFISVAATIMNRRKSRAGHSLEHHVEHLLGAGGISFDAQPRIDGKVKPDILIPGKAAYEDTTFPLEGLTVLALKTTCKDRWRQILNEARRIPDKHLLTLQPSISRNQLIEMRDARVRLVVPRRLQENYDKTTGIVLLTIEEFLARQRVALN